MAMAAQSWRALLAAALESNSHLKHSSYFQLATVSVNGRPANRTVVFRGFQEGCDNILINTDIRTSKICWYFTESWEQFRINGRIDIVNSSTRDLAKLQQREDSWFASSLASRMQYSGPVPRLPAIEVPRKDYQLDPSMGPVDSFCLLVFNPEQVWRTAIVCLLLQAASSSLKLDVKRIFTVPSCTGSWQPGNNNLLAYSDSDWTSDTKDRKSTTGYCVFLGDNLVTWRVQKQRTVARSSTEAEYRAIASVTTEVIWLRRLLDEFGIKCQEATDVHRDNTSAIAIAQNPIYYARTKHIEIDHYFIRDHINAKEINLVQVPSHEQLADILTKGLSIPSFIRLRNKLKILPLESLT